MKNVYICEPNCVIHKNGEALTVRKYREKLMDISLIDVTTILIFGNTQLTTQAISAILNCNIDIIFLTMGGRIKGRLRAESGSNIVVRVAQYGKWFDIDERVLIAKELIIRKIQSQIETIQRFRYTKKCKKLLPAEKELELLVGQLEEATSVGEIMGVEGRAASIYFSNFQEFLINYSFKGRERRPAYDPVNALLNLTYSFLKNEIATISLCYSLDLQLGFLHSIRSGRESLAFDLMEPYRSIFADRFVIQLLNKAQIKDEDFTLSEEGLRLTESALKRFCMNFQKHLYEDTYQGVTWKRVFEQDILRFKRRLMKKK